MAKPKRKAKKIREVNRGQEQTMPVSKAGHWASRTALLVAGLYAGRLLVGSSLFNVDVYHNMDVDSNEEEVVKDSRMEEVVKDSRMEEVVKDSRISDDDDKQDANFAGKQFDQLIEFKQGDPFAGISFNIHRNGEGEKCDQTKASSSTTEAFRETLLSAYYPAPFDMEMHHIDSLLTQTFTNHLVSQDACFPITYNSVWPIRKPKSIPGLLNFCDMGEARTVLLPDHNDLVHVNWNGKSLLPCHFHTREGVRVVSIEQLAHIARVASKKTNDSCNSTDGESQTCTGETGQIELDLYAVPAGRVFMFAPSFVGEIFEIPNLSVKSGLPVSLEVISLEPRVFDVINFYDDEESKSVVDKALAEKSESHRIKRSSTGASGYNVNSHRTSENGFDTHGKVSMTLKKRCFEILGFVDYDESFADGLQVLRYNKTTAYIPHLDWIDDYQKAQAHDYDSPMKGTNRFATILLYMSNLPEGGGGETVFAKGWPADVPESDRVALPEALRMVRKSEEITSLFKRKSWQEKMVAECRTRLNVHPHSSRAVLFYSQHPDGTPDESSLHGGCPVLAGEKWAANLWVWNGPRDGYPGNPKNEKLLKQRREEGKEDEESQESPGGTTQLQAVFTNSGEDPKMKNAKLFFQETYWSELGISSVNTYEGHEWNVIVDDKVVQTFVIGKDRKQTYTI